MASIAMPTWLRIVLVAGVVVLITGAGLFAYRWYSRPATLTVAVGSLDGEAPKLMSALASRLAAVNARVRLTLVETSSALDAADMFSSGKTDLAVVRGDVGDLSQAQAVVILAHAVVLLVAPPGSSITDIAGLKRATVGVVGGETNQRVVNALTEEYDLGRAGVTFRNLAPAETRRALESRQVRAVLIVVPLAEKYLALLRGLFLQNSKTAPVLIPIEAAGAIAEKQRAYESFDVPKGTLRGSPPVPSDDLTTLKVSFYVVAKKQLDNDEVTDLTEALMNARRDLLGELPMLAQMTAPSTDSDAYLSLHPGAAAFYNGTQQTFLDKWGMIAGGLLWFSQVPATGGSYAADVLARRLLAAVGLGFSFVPVTIAAVTGTKPHEAGLASGLINTSQQVGGALGLAILATIATAAPKACSTPASTAPRSRSPKALTARSSSAPASPSSERSSPPC